MHPSGCMTTFVGKEISSERWVGLLSLGHGSQNRVQGQLRFSKIQNTKFNPSFPHMDPAGEDHERDLMPGKLARLCLTAINK